MDCPHGNPPGSARDCACKPTYDELREENARLGAEVARLEGLILDWDNENTSTDDWRRACESLEAEARRIRAAKGE